MLLVAVRRAPGQLHRLPRQRRHEERLERIPQHGHVQHAQREDGAQRLLPPLVAVQRSRRKASGSAVRSSRTSCSSRSRRSFSSRTRRTPVPYIGQPSNITTQPPATQAAVDSFVNILKTKYGFADPGNAALWRHEESAHEHVRPLRPHQSAGEQPSRRALQLRQRATRTSSARSATRLALSNNGYTINDATNSGTRAALLERSERRTNEVTRRLHDDQRHSRHADQAPFVVISRVSELRQRQRARSPRARRTRRRATSSTRRSPS